jgi:hypothetical protein
MRIERTDILNNISNEREDSRFLAKNILTPDDDHIGRNM